MRIKRIFVRDLFNIFNHDIPLRTDDRITIIHAPNGYGKTAILTMLDGLFNSRYGPLRTYPYDTLGVEFTDGSTFTVSKTPPKKSKGETQANGKPALHFAYKGENYTTRSLPSQRDLPIPLSAIDDVVPELTRIGNSLWSNPAGEALSLDDVFERYGEYFQFSHTPDRTEPIWLKELKKLLDVRYIRTERLQVLPSGRASQRERRIPFAPAVAEYASELAEVIKTTLAQYAEISQSLDRSFPTRIVSELPSADVSKETLTKRFEGFEKKRSFLAATGLLDKEQEPAFPLLLNIDPAKLSVLAVYADDIQQKLSVFDSIASKINLFQSTVNSRFRHKRMSIEREKGFVFTTSAGTNLQPTSLSSGEQHELVMLFDLLFKVKANSLILIDEPELSLHIAWQEQFLRDLAGMTELSDFDVVIATHSPQIISDHYDWTVALHD